MHERGHSRLRTAQLRSYLKRMRFCIYKLIKRIKALRPSMPVRERAERFTQRILGAYSAKSISPMAMRLTRASECRL